MNDTTNQNEITLKKCEQERQEYLEGWQRARADFINYKKEQASAMSEYREFADEDFAEELLPVLDNFARACDSLPETLKDNVWVKGIINIRRQFKDILSLHGVEEMSVNKGDRFDPAYHEAVGEGEGEGESGTIGEILQKGYTIHGKVIKVARVKVIIKSL